jgi:hypothetical protein
MLSGYGRNSMNYYKITPEGNLLPDVVLKNFEEIDIYKKCTMPSITIYNSPEDYPGKYVARLFDSAIPSPTVYIVFSDRLENIRNIIPKEMVRFIRSENDDKYIVETWL